MATSYHGWSDLALEKEYSRLYSLSISGNAKLSDELELKEIEHEQEIRAASGNNPPTSATPSRPDSSESLEPPISNIGGNTPPPSGPGIPQIPPGPPSDAGPLPDRGGFPPQPPDKQYVPLSQMNIPTTPTPGSPVPGGSGVIDPPIPPPPPTPPKPEGDDSKGMGFQEAGRIARGLREVVSSPFETGGSGSVDFQGMGNMGSTQTMGGVGQAAGGMISGLGKMTGQPELQLLGDFISTIAGATDAVRDWIKGLHQANMEFAEFSGAMADVRAQQTTREIQLNMERGDRRAGTAEELAQAMHKMNEAFAKVEDKFANFFNQIGVVLAEILETTAKIFNQMLGGDDNTPPAITEGVTMLEQLNIVTNQVDMERFGQPDRFGGGNAPPRRGR